MPKELSSKRELDWFKFLSQKGRYIGGLVESDEGIGGQYRGTIADIEIDRSFVLITTDDAECNVGDGWEPMDDFEVGAHTDYSSAPIVKENGQAVIHLIHIGVAVLTPAKHSPADLEGKVVVMETNVPNEDGHVFSVESAECYAEEHGGMVEYLENGEARIWVQPK